MDDVDVSNTPQLMPIRCIVVYLLFGAKNRHITLAVFVILLAAY